jgi:hypothetical protein
LEQKSCGKKYLIEQTVRTNFFSLKIARNIWEHEKIRIFRTKTVRTKDGGPLYCNSGTEVTDTTCWDVPVTHAYFKRRMCKSEDRSKNFYKKMAGFSIANRVARFSSVILTKNGENIAIYQQIHQMVINYNKCIIDRLAIIYTIARP